MKPLVPAAAIAALLAGAGAGRADGPQQQAPVQEVREVRGCSELLRGVSLVTRPIAGGVALEFTSSRRREVAELREQLREAALELHSRSRVQPARIPRLDISVNDVGAGARVVIRAQRARDIPELLELARTLEQFWSSSDCTQEIGERERVTAPVLRA